MKRLDGRKRAVSGWLVILCAILATGQAQSLNPHVTVTVVDETGKAVEGAAVTINEPGLDAAHLWTDYAGNCTVAPRQEKPYRIHVEKAGFYQSDESGIEASESSVRVVLAHEQIVREQVNVTASTPGIDVEEPAGEFTLNTQEIVNIPYAESRDIRNLLQFNPGLVQDNSGQTHVAGSEVWETLDTLDGFDIRAPLGGALSLRVSADAVRSIEAETTRVPAEYGRSTGGVVALRTGMGDDKFRFNVTNFIPSVQNKNGLRFDQFVPRLTFSGPIERGRAWWYDAMEGEADNIYISELPGNSNTDFVMRASNLAKLQANLTPANILTAGLLYNNYHAPYEGLSALRPQESTLKRNTLAWFPFVRDQQSMGGGALLDVGAGAVQIRDGYEPRGSTPYVITPEMAEGSYFENLVGRSQRVEGNAVLYLPPRSWRGRHDLKAGVDLDRIRYEQRQTRGTVSYRREDGTLERKSTFAATPAFTMHNAEAGGFIEDRWTPAKGWIVEPGLRFDWDEIVRRPLISPRLAMVFAPAGDKNTTKVSAGIGVYYEHTQLSYLTAAYAGERSDTYYAADGTTASGAAQATEFVAEHGLLNEPRALNWSVGIERKLPGGIFGGANYVEKRTTKLFTYANQSGAAALAGEYLLTNGREDRYRAEEFDARRIFANGYTVFVSYTHSKAHTNAALDYWPTPSPLGAQQSGPLGWDTPNRVFSWGWLPTPLPMLRKRWDLVYFIDAHSGFPYTAVNAAGQVAGVAGAYRFPTVVNFSPGAEWKFHFRGQYWGLRGVIENITDRANPVVVNNVVDSPEFGSFSQFQGRAVTARIRLIETK